MKLYALIALTLVGVLLFAGLAFAQEAEAESVVTTADAETTEMSADPGTTPDSAMYGLKTGWERFRLAFTFNQERKAQKELELAKLKLLEVRKMAEKGNLRAMARAQERHDTLVESAQARLDAIQEDTTEAKAKIAAEKVIGLERALKAHENRIEVLKDILAEKNLSDEARVAIETAVERMENKTATMQQKIEERKDKIKTRLRAITEKNESEIENEIAELEDKANLTEALKKIAENRIEKTEAALEKVKARIAEEEAAGIDVSGAETHIAKAEANLAKAKALVEKGKYKEAIATLKPISNYGRNLSIVVKKIQLARLAEKKAELANLVREAAKEKVQAWQNLSLEARQEIKTAVQEQVQQKLKQTATETEE